MNDPQRLIYRIFERTTARAGRSRRRFYQRQLELGFAPVRQRWAPKLEALGVNIELLRPIIPAGATKHSHKKLVLVPVRCAEVIYRYNDARAKHPDAEPGFAGLSEDTVARLAAEAWRATLREPVITATTGPALLSEIVDSLGGPSALISLMKKGDKIP